MALMILRCSLVTPSYCSNFCSSVRCLGSNFFKLNVLDGKLDTNSTAFHKGQESSSVAQEALQKLYSRVHKGGGEKAIHRHTVINRKILPRERLKRLFDDGSEILEIAPLAGLAMDYGDVPGAGGIIAIGKINGIYSAGLINDATVKAGAIYPIGVVKNMRAQQIVFDNHLPCVYMVDSAGAFLPLQADLFPDRNHGGRTFYSQAVLSEENIPQIVMVCGSCTAGAAYIPTMAEQTVIVKGIGTVFLAGPPLVKAATGEEITSEELGGADLHCRISGCTDYYAEDEQEAIDYCRDIILTCNLEDRPTPRSNLIQEPVFDQNELSGIAGQSAISKELIYKILARILDGSKFHEFKGKFGKNLIVGFGFIESQLTGIVSNCGPLTVEDAQKGGHLISLCNKRHIPLVFLQNSSGGDGEVSLEEAGIILKERGKMIALHSCATVPKIVINMGGCYGDDNFTMCGESFKPNFLFSWPLAHTRPYRNSEENHNSGKFDIEEELECSSSPFFRSSRLYQDGIILPQDTRKILSFCLQVSMSGYYRKLHSRLKEYPPVIRM